MLKKYIYGGVKANNYSLQIVQPQIISKSNIGKFNPIYDLTAGLTNNELKKIIKSCLTNYRNLIIDYLPDSFVKENEFYTLNKAIDKIHYPKSIEELNDSRRRLAFDELFTLQVALDKNNFRNNSLAGPKIAFEGFKKIINKYINSLNFKLTNAQIRVFNEIATDMSSKNMNRLLQGDVGSGKTIIASLAAYLVYLNGYQTALMVPTEILAKQHFFSLKKLLSPLGMNVQLITGETKQKDRELILDELANGKISLIIGTHSLIQDDIKFSNLGLTIIDEQHRFGVEQRKALFKKGLPPHNLSMTATPIPRTLALIIYGDMDISSIDELPSGRKPVDTFVVDDSYLDRLDKFVVEQVKAGHQVFVVCPLIEENDTMPLKSLEEVFNHYNSEFFTSLGIKSAYLHGKMKNEEKNEIMTSFVNGDIQIIVSTTVIEVGINVPNANLMIIFNADRFGLSQLHQLRGRVGRGSDKAFCVLINNSKSEIAYKRMKVMKQSNDGFYISEQDLLLRGQGELMGTRQHGIAEFKFLDFKLDLNLIEYVKSNYKYIYEKITENNVLYSELFSYIDDISKVMTNSEN